jgi:hypothetical protein
VVYNLQGSALNPTNVIAKKIKTNIFYINDFKKNSTWSREYVTYDSNRKQIIDIIIDTSETTGFSPTSVSFFNQIEASFIPFK